MYFEYRSHLIDSNHIQRIIFWWQYWLQASNINNNCEHFQTYRFLYIDDMASTCTGIQSVFDWGYYETNPHYPKPSNLKIYLISRDTPYWVII